MRRLVALYRSPTYSPQQHRGNDRWILDATTASIARHGWEILKATERDVEEERVPEGDLYLNMCQGPSASERLLRVAAGGAVVVNPPVSVLNCHRHRLAPMMAAAGVPFPRTVLLPTSGAALPPLHELNGDHRPIWVKRGDVHAERPEDVVAAPAEQVAVALAAFAARGVRSVALQAHVPGPIVKFYAVAGGFFHWYPAGDVVAVDEHRLRALAMTAAGVLGLEVFGGDVAVPRADAPVLIDINDWPSFAPVRDRAAEAIGRYIQTRVTNGRHQ